MLIMKEIRPGKVIKMQDAPYVVLTSDHSKTAQRRPVLRTKLKNLLTGTVLEYSFAQSEKAEEADLERGKQAQYLYKDENSIYLMDQESFEQFGLPLDQVEAQLPFLTEGENVLYMSFEGKPVALDLPPKVDLKIIEAPDAVKGDSAQGRVMKTAKAQSGYEFQVPLFIKEGDVIRVNTETGDYVERVNS